MTDMPERVFRTNVYNDVHHERERAHAKHGANGNSRENAVWTDVEWLAILGEEFGEVCHELTYDTWLIANGTHIPHPDSVAARSRLRAELLQVAAMATSWVDAIDRA